MLFSLGGALAAAVAFNGCSGSQGASAGKTGRAPLMVRVATVAMQELVYQIKALGSLEAEELVQVTAEVEGAVTEVRFHEGDLVTPKTLLARIDPDRYR